MLANISFIGQLYVAGMLTSPILHICCAKLLNEGNVTETPDNDDTEALIKLLRLTGAALEKDEQTGKVQPKLPVIFQFIQQFTRHSKLDSRLRFLCQDLIDLRNNKWQLTGAAAAVERGTKTLSLKEAQEAIAREEIEEKKRLLENPGGKGSGAGGIGTSARQMRGGASTPTPSGGAGAGAASASGGGGGTQDVRALAQRSGGRPQSSLGMRGRGAPGTPTGSATPSSPSGEEWTTVGPNGRRAASAATGAGSPAEGARDASPAPAERGPAGAGAGFLEVKEVVLTGTDLSKKATGIWSEFVSGSDLEELVRSVTEIRKSPGMGGALVFAGLAHSDLSKDAYRNAVSRSLPTLAARGLLSREDVVAGLGQFMATYLEYDAPKIGHYLSSVSYNCFLRVFYNHLHSSPTLARMMTGNLILTPLV
jgi:hypothetical protein